MYVAETLHSRDTKRKLFQLWGGGQFSRAKWFSENSSPVAMLINLDGCRLVNDVTRRQLHLSSAKKTPENEKTRRPISLG